MKGTQGVDGQAGIRASETGGSHRQGSEKSGGFIPEGSERRNEIF